MRVFSRKTVGLLRTILERMTPESQPTGFWKNVLFDFGLKREVLDLMRIRGFQWANILPDLHAERFGDNNSYFSNSLSGPDCREALEQLLAFAVQNDRGSEIDELVKLAKADGFEVSLPAPIAPSSPKAGINKPLVPPRRNQDAAVSRTSRVPGGKPWTRDQKIGLVAVILTLILIIIAIATPEIRKKIGLEKPVPTASGQSSPEKPTATISPALSPQRGENTSAPSGANNPSKSKSRPKQPETKQAPGVSSSGTDSPAIGSITQAPGSALSINQQGGITAGTVNNLGPLLLPTATVTVCATYPDVVAGEDFQSVVTFTTSRQLPRPWFALFFDGPVLDGSARRVKGSYGYTHGRAEKLPNPENSFIFRTIAMELGGTSSWFPADGPIRATVSSKSRVQLIKIMAGGGDDPDIALPVNLVFSCG